MTTESRKDGGKEKVDGLSEIRRLQLPERLLNACLDKEKTKTGSGFEERNLQLVKEATADVEKLVKKFGKTSKDKEDIYQSFFNFRSGFFHIWCNEHFTGEKTSLLIAASEGKAKVVDFLLHYGASKSSSSSVANSKTSSNAATSSSNATKTSTILPLSAFNPYLEINAVDDDGCSALFLAVERGSLAVVKLLLQHPNLDVNLKENDHRNLSGNDGRNSRSYDRNGSLVSMSNTSLSNSRNFGSSIESGLGLGKSLGSTTSLSNGGVTSNGVNSISNTADVVSSYSGPIGRTAFHVALEVEANLTNDAGFKRRSSTRLTRHKISELDEYVRLLVNDSRTDLNSYSALNSTPLVFACRHSSAERVQMLLRYAIPESGQSPLKPRLDINLTDPSSGNSPLLAVINYAGGETNFQNYFQSEKLRAILPIPGLDISYINPQTHMTAYWMAFQHRRFDLVEIFDQFFAGKISVMKNIAKDDNNEIDLLATKIDLSATMMSTSSTASGSLNSSLASSLNSSLNSSSTNGFNSNGINASMTSSLNSSIGSTGSQSFGQQEDSSRPGRQSEKQSSEEEEYEAKTTILELSADQLLAQLLDLHKFYDARYRIVLEKETKHKVMTAKAMWSTKAKAGSSDNISLESLPKFLYELDNDAYDKFRQENGCFIQDYILRELHKTESTIGQQLRKRDLLQLRTTLNEVLVRCIQNNITLAVPDFLELLPINQRKPYVSSLYKNRGLNGGQKTHCIHREGQKKPVDVRFSGHIDILRGLLWLRVEDLIVLEGSNGSKSSTTIPKHSLSREGTSGSRPGRPRSGRQKSLPALTSSSSQSSASSANSTAAHDPRISGNGASNSSTHTATRRPLSAKKIWGNDVHAKVRKTVGKLKLMSMISGSMTAGIAGNLDDSIGAVGQQCQTAAPMGKCVGFWNQSGSQSGSFKTLGERVMGQKLNQNPVLQLQSKNTSLGPMLDSSGGDQNGAMRDSSRVNQNGTLPNIDYFTDVNCTFDDRPLLVTTFYKKESSECLEFLLSRPDIDLCKRNHQNGLTPLMACCQVGNFTNFEIYLKAYCKRQETNTGLSYATKLEERRSYVNAQDNIGATSLYYLFAKREYSVSRCKCMSLFYETFKFIIDKSLSLHDVKSSVNTNSIPMVTPTLIHTYWHHLKGTNPIEVQRRSLKRMKEHCSVALIDWISPIEPKELMFLTRKLTGMVERSRYGRNEEDIQTAKALVSLYDFTRTVQSKRLNDEQNLDGNAGSGHGNPENEQNSSRDTPDCSPSDDPKSYDESKSWRNGRSAPTKFGIGKNQLKGVNSGRNAVASSEKGNYTNRGPHSDYTRDTPAANSIDYEEEQDYVDDPSERVEEFDVIVTVNDNHSRIVWDYLLKPLLNITGEMRGNGELKKVLKQALLYTKGTRESYKEEYKDCVEGNFHKIENEMNLFQENLVHEDELNMKNEMNLFQENLELVSKTASGIPSDSQSSCVIPKYTVKAVKSTIDAGLSRNRARRHLRSSEVSTVQNQNGVTAKNENQFENSGLSTMVTLGLHRSSSEPTIRATTAVGSTRSNSNGVASMNQAQSDFRTTRIDFRSRSRMKESQPNTRMEAEIDCRSPKPNISSTQSDFRTKKNDFSSTQTDFRSKRKCGAIYVNEPAKAPGTLPSLATTRPSTSGNGSRLARTPDPIPRRPSLKSTTISNRPGTRGSLIRENSSTAGTNSRTNKDPSKEKDGPASLVHAAPVDFYNGHTKTFHNFSAKCFNIQYADLTNEDSTRDENSSAKDAASDNLCDEKLHELMLRFISTFSPQSADASTVLREFSQKLDPVFYSGDVRRNVPGAILWQVSEALNCEFQSRMKKIFPEATEAPSKKLARILVKGEEYYREIYLGESLDEKGQTTDPTTTERSAETTVGGSETEPNTSKTEPSSVVKTLKCDESKPGVPHNEIELALGVQRVIDTVRCSVTIDDGVSGMLQKLDTLKKLRMDVEGMELVRVKNSHSLRAPLGPGGYRDVKANILFKSRQRGNPVLICEVILLFSRVLELKKHMHHLYSCKRGDFD